MGETVLIVDDHPAFRASARRLLEDEGYRVVGEAGDGSSAVALARELQPDVVLLDIVLPDVNGIDLAEQLAGEHDVVLVSSRDRGDFGPALARAPARGFISKSDFSGAALARVLRR